MHTFNRSIHAAGAASPSRLTAVVVFTLMLFISACSDTTAPAAPADSPSLLSQSLFASVLTQASSGSSDFAVLANAAVTCSYGNITGDVGTYLAPDDGSFTQTNCEVNGSIHLGDGLAEQAYEDFLAEYAALAEVECDVVLTGTLADVTLAPGTYCFTAAATLAGTLTLKGPANGTWLFKIGTSGTGALTGTNFSVVMAGGGEACNVTWWVAEGVTMTDSNFKGNILAGGAITMTDGTFYGNAWAGASEVSEVGDVTITRTTTIGCEGSNGGGNGNGNDKGKCNQGVGNGPEDCDPGNSNHNQPSNDEEGGTPGNPGRKGKP